MDSTFDQKSSLKDYISLFSTEPTVLAHEVNLWFFTRPELVADEKGRSMPGHTDQYISGAVFDAVHVSALSGGNKCFSRTSIVRNMVLCASP
jgi:hypothetical protein